MDVTSNHLDIVPLEHLDLGENSGADVGEELSKRSEFFGQPVGKSVLLVASLRFRHTDIRSIQTNPV